MMVRALASAAIVVALTTPAAADYTEVAPVRPLTLIDPSGLSVVGIDVQWTTWTAVVQPVGPTDFSSLTFDVAADIRVAPHWMVLVRVPFDKASIDPGPPNDCCELALGNLTLGGRGLWARRHANGLRSVVGGELTIALPTASDGVDRGLSATTAAFTQLPHDPSLFAPNLTAVSFSLLSQLYHRWWLLQAEAGLSLYFFDGDVAGNDHFDVAGRVALGGGLRVTYRLALIAELGARFFDSDLITPGADTATSLDLGVRYASSVVIVGARFYLPLDSEQRDFDMLGFGLDAGWRF
jgi:hypothetical protein